MSVDPLASDYAAWSTYNYVFGNPISFIDPDGRSGENVNNEYIRDIRTGKTTQVSTAGGDEVDIVMNGTTNDDGSFTVTSTEVMDVAHTEVGEGYMTAVSRTPGSHLSFSYMPAQGVAATLDGGDDPIFNLLTLGTAGVASKGVSGTLGMATKRVRSSTLRRLWEKATGNKWPKEPEYLPDGSPNPYYKTPKGKKRNQSVSHKEALEDGGTNKVDNIEPEPWKLHHQRHKDNGDFKRWGKKKKD